MFKSSVAVIGHWLDATSQHCTAGTVKSDAVPIVPDVEDVFEDYHDDLCWSQVAELRVLKHLACIVSTPLLAHLGMYSSHWMCVVNLWMWHASGCDTLVDLEVAVWLLNMDSKKGYQIMSLSEKMCPCVFRWVHKCSNDNPVIFGSGVSH